jgi:hypothetical protein
MKKNEFSDTSGLANGNMTESIFFNQDIKYIINKLQTRLKGGIAFAVPPFLSNNFLIS